MKIKRFFLLFFAVIAVGVCSASSEKEDLTKYVNQWLGTGGHGHVCLGAAVPRGLV